MAKHFMERVHGAFMLRAWELAPNFALSHAAETARDAFEVINRFDRSYPYIENSP